MYTYCCVYIVLIARLFVKRNNQLHWFRLFRSRLFLQGRVLLFPLEIQNCITRKEQIYVHLYKTKKKKKYGLPPSKMINLSATYIVIFLHNCYLLALISTFFLLSVITCNYLFISPFNRLVLYYHILHRCLNIYASLILVVSKLFVFTYVDSPLIRHILHLNTVCRRAGTPPHN